MSFANYQPNQSSFYYILKSTGIAFKRSKRQNTEHFIIYPTVLLGIRLSRHKEKNDCHTSQTDFNTSLKLDSDLNLIMYHFALLVNSVHWHLQQS